MKDIVKIATNEIGIKEIKGESTNPRILEYAKATGFEKYKSDESAWCSLFVNWCAQEAGLERSYSLGARSWLRVGVPVTNPEPGDIVIFWRNKKESWQGHVGFFMGLAKNDRIYCLGGNQRNQVSITAKPKERLLGYRRLRPSKEVNFPRKILKKGSTGELVVLLQDALKKLGFDDVGTSDGVFGERTKKSLKDFQSTNENLTINGVFDKDTREYMESILKGMVTVNTLLEKIF